MPTVSNLTEEAFLDLRRELSGRIGERRFRHTLAVEEEIVSLGKLYLPHDVNRLRIAALLHDLTKEWKAEEQIAFCRQHGIALSPAELAAPKVLHAKTGAFLARMEYQHLADDEIVDAISLHTVAAWGMTLFSSLLYLADYIEPTRTYEDCIALRKAFYDGYCEKDKDRHLAKIMLRALRASVEEIRARGAEPIADTLSAIDYFELKARP